MDEKITNFGQKSPAQAVPDAPILPVLDVAKMPGFLLNAPKLMASELMAKSTGAVFKAAVRLWCMAWQQTPAASLPNDDKVLAKFADIEHKHFKKLKNEVLRGFQLCSDGRWYHPVLVECARAAARRHDKYMKDREADNNRLKNWRKRQHETGDETGFTGADETGFETGVTPEMKPVSKRVEKEKEKKIVERDTPDRPVGGRSETRGTRWPADAVIPDEWFDAAATRRSAEGMLPVNLTLQAELFTNYWASKSGKDATKIDWKRTWINWVLNAKGDSNGRGRGSKSQAEYDGARAAIQYFDAKGRADQGEVHGDDAVPAHPALPSH